MKVTNTIGLTLEELERRAYAEGDVQTSRLIIRALEEAEPEAIQSAYDSGYDAGKADGYEEGLYEGGC